MLLLSSALSLGFRSVFLFEAERRPPWESLCAALQPFSARLHLWKAGGMDIARQFPLRRLWRGGTEDHLTGTTDSPSSLSLFPSLSSPCVILHPPLAHIPCTALSIHIPFIFHSYSIAWCR